MSKKIEQQIAERKAREAAHSKELRERVEQMDKQAADRLEMLKAQADVARAAGLWPTAEEQIFELGILADLESGVVVDPADYLSGKRFTMEEVAGASSVDVRGEGAEGIGIGGPRLTSRTVQQGASVGPLHDAEGNEARDGHTGEITTGALPDAVREMGKHVHHDQIILAFRMVDHLGGPAALLECREVIGSMRGKAGRPTKEQKEWMDRLRWAAWRVGAPEDWERYRTAALALLLGPGTPMRRAQVLLGEDPAGYGAKKPRRPEVADYGSHKASEQESERHKLHLERWATNWYAKQAG